MVIILKRIKIAKRTHLDLIVANVLIELIVMDTSEESRHTQRKGKNILESRSEHEHLLASKTQNINNA